MFQTGKLADSRKRPSITIKKAYGLLEAKENKLS
jgi:hypothetical protein